MKPNYCMIKGVLVLALFGFFSCVPQSPTTDTDTGTSTLPDSTILDVSYGGHQRQKYDAYLPAKRDVNTPVLFMIHGGGWKEGRKEDMNEYVNLIKAKWSNVAIINMNYRLASNSDNIHHNEIISDIEAAVNHVKSAKTAYQISTAFGVMGHSAGGNLAMIYAYKYNTEVKCVANLAGPSNLSDWDYYNSFNLWLGESVSAVMTRYIGQPWDTTAYKAVSPYWNISSTSQPTIIFHPSGDLVVPFYQSERMKSKLTTLGIPNELHEYPSLDHSFGNLKDDLTNKLIAYFRRNLK